MKMIIGLGNPGIKYEETRHNVGFMVLDKLVSDGDWKESKKLKGVLKKNTKMVFLKPSTFMNNSGQAVVGALRFYKVQLEDMWMVHDDLDLELGEYKIQKGVGPKVHNGLSSVEECLGNKNFWRVRIGVDNRKGERVLPGEEYVLSKFSDVEKRIVDKVILKVVEELRGVLE